MSESDFIPPPEAQSSRPLSKKERREARRRARREEAEQEEREANEPEPEPTICAWCGFSAFFDEETPDTEKMMCPACSQSFESGPNPNTEPDGPVAQKKRDAVHRRIATALDSIFALLSEQWEEATAMRDAGRF